MRVSYIVLVVAMLAIPSVGHSQQEGLVGGKVGKDLSTSPTQPSAPAGTGPYGRPVPIGRPAGYAGSVAPGQVVPDDVQVTPRPGGMGTAYVDGHRVLVDPSNRVLRVLK
jgi:hypothetical protein